MADLCKRCVREVFTKEDAEEAKNAFNSEREKGDIYRQINSALIKEFGEEVASKVIGFVADRIMLVHMAAYSRGFEDGVGHQLTKTWKQGGV